MGERAKGGTGRCSSQKACADGGRVPRKDDEKAGTTSEAASLALNLVGVVITTVSAVKTVSVHTGC